MTRSQPRAAGACNATVSPPYLIYAEHYKNKSHLIHNDGNVLMGDLLVPQVVAVVEGDHLNVVLPSRSLPLGADQDVQTPVIEVTHQDRMLIETLRHRQVLAVLPDEHVLELLEVYVLNGGAVRSLITEMTV